MKMLRETASSGHEQIKPVPSLNCTEAELAALSHPVCAALQMFRWLWWAWAFEFVVWFLICISLILRWMHRGFAQGLLSLLAVSQCHILSLITWTLLSLLAVNHHTIKPGCTKDKAPLSVSRLPACSNC